MRTPSNRSQVPPFAVVTILDKVAKLREEGRDVISLCAGEPLEGAPAPVRRALQDVMWDGTELGYTPAFGIPPLRRKLAEHYQRTYGIAVNPRNIAVTTGSSGAFSLAFLAGFNPGDRVAIARPGYPAYKNIMRALDLEVVEIPCGPADGYRFTADHLAHAHAEGPLAGVLVASPANPTGTMTPEAELRELTRWCADHDVLFVSDEIYHGLTFGDVKQACTWQWDTNTLVINSFSKYWGMTGWRLGWMLVPDYLVDSVDALASNLALCAPVPAQHAALAAFDQESLQAAERCAEGFKEARNLALSALPALGWTDIAPADGAFYIYANLGRSLGGYADSAQWCQALLEQQGVALTPGTDFDAVDGGHTVRMSLAPGADLVGRAIDRIKTFLAP